MYAYPKKYAVIVIGAGHAGIEAALAAARMGCETLLLTHNADTIGQMSCNPAIGGSAKGHIVREIDALGGEMGKSADLTAIQLKMLNKSRGPAVWSPRAQCDKKAYQQRMKHVCEQQPRLDLMQQQVASLTCEAGKVTGVITNLGVHFLGDTVVITTGTFLKALLHYGDKNIPGGRSGDHTSLGLSDSLQQIGLSIIRFKTGTPPRLLSKSLDYSRMSKEVGDDPPPLFSHWWEMANESHSTQIDPEFTSQPVEAHLSLSESSPASSLFHVEQPRDFLYPPDSLCARLGSQVSCYLTFTTPKTKEVVLGNLHLSAMYSGRIEGLGPRYCPSIEDKFVRFAEKTQHQVFIEPEGIHTEEVYVNGCSSSLPFEVQIQLIRSLPGCENAIILRPAYAVEYDCCPPQQLHPWLETKVCANLFLGGQINGTSGYEEAAAQGLIAGINAALRAMGLSPLVLRRNEAYIGVMIDDLVTKGITEPYRMFTSRVEHRLLLRQDNADLRLAQVGHKLGLVSNNLYLNVLDKQSAIDHEINRLKQTKVNGSILWSLLRRPELSYSQLPHGAITASNAVIQQVEIQAKYEGYFARHQAETEKLFTLEEKRLPPNPDYQSIRGLRREARDSLEKFRPTNIGQAARLSGITPSDVAVLLTWLKKSPSIQPMISKPS